MAAGVAVAAALPPTGLVKSAEEALAEHAAAFAPPRLELGIGRLFGAATPVFEPETRVPVAMRWVETGLVEPGGGYARAAVSLTATADGRRLHNSAAIVFPTPSADWGVIDGIELFADDEPIIWAPLTMPVVVLNGDHAPGFAAGTIMLTIGGSSPRTFYDALGRPLPDVVTKPGGDDPPPMLPLM